MKVHQLRIDPITDDIWVTGTFENAVALSLGGPPVSGFGGFLLHLDPNGAYVEHMSFTTSGATPTSLRLELRDGARRRVLGEYYQDSTFDTAPLAPLTALTDSTVPPSLFLALYNTDGTGYLSKHWTAAGGRFESRAMTILLHRTASSGFGLVLRHVPLLQHLGQRDG